MSECNIVIAQDEDGVFVACCLELPGCVSQGMSWKEAKANLEEARQGYLECLSRRGEEIPPTFGLLDNGEGLDS